MINVLTAGGIKLRTPKKITGRSAAGWGVAFILLLLFLSHSPAAGRVYHYRDNQGVLHITNVPPAGEGEANGDAPPEMVPGRSQRMAAQRLRGTGIGPASSPSSLSSEGGITRLVDAQGVITITNKASAAKPAEPAVHRTEAAAPAVAKQGEEEEEEEKDEEEDKDDKADQSKAPGLALPLLPPLRQVSASSPEKNEPGRLLASAATGSGGSIRRFRDGNGVLNIVNAPPTLMASARPLPLERPPEGVQTASSGAGGTRPRGRLEVSPAEAAAAGPQNPGRQVVAYRDKKGVLCVSNAPSQLSGAGPGRGVGGRAPPEALEPFIQEAASRYRLPVELVCAIIQEESNFTVGAVSPKGALGLMQLMPGTAAFVGVQNPLDPRENILGGCAYFRLLLNFFQENLPLALAAYNAGYMRVVAADYRIPAIKETQEFVYRVLGRYFLNDRQGLLARNI
jgi:hypothetical protein